MGGEVMYGKGGGPPPRRTAPINTSSRERGSSSTSGSRRKPRSRPTSRQRDPELEGNRREAKGRDAKMQQAYEDGLAGRPFKGPNYALPAYQSGEDEAKTPTGKAKSAAKGARKKARSYARPSSRRRAQVRASRRKLGKAAGQLTRPATQQVTSGTQAVVLSLVVVALYLVLSNSSPLNGFLGGLGRAVDWLARPDVSIPYGPGH